MKRASLLGGAIAAALGLGFGATAAGAAETWSMATAWTGGPVLEQAAKRVARNIEFLTNNEIKVEVFPGGTMGSPLKVTETVRNGVTEIGHSWSAVPEAEHGAVIRIRIGLDPMVVHPMDRRRDDDPRQGGFKCRRQA